MSAPSVSYEQEVRSASGRLSLGDDGELSSAVKTNYVTPLRLELLGPSTPERPGTSALAAHGGFGYHAPGWRYGGPNFVGL